MDGWGLACVRCLLLGILELSLFQTVITVLHGGRMHGYALPRPLLGCEEHWVDFKVRLKYSNITHDTEISEKFTIALDTLNDDNVLFEFCVQNRTAGQRATADDPVLDWPVGQYCINSVGKIVRTEEGRFDWVLGDCPPGFQSGVTALPFQSFPGQRMVDVTSPLSLTYPNITLIHYCCSTSGNVNNTVDLGMVAPFYLMPYGQRQCQKVLNMESDLQYIEWPVAELRQSGTHPYSFRGRRFYYCYYIPMGLGMEHDIFIATFGVAIGTPTVTVIIICLCKLRGKLMARRKHFKRFQSVM